MSNPKALEITIGARRYDPAISQALITFPEPCCPGLVALGIVSADEPEASRDSKQVSLEMSPIAARLGADRTGG